MIDNDPIDTPKADDVSSVNAPSTTDDDAADESTECDCCCCTGSCRNDSFDFDQEVFD